MREDQEMSLSIDFSGAETFAAPNRSPAFVFEDRHGIAEA
jgi:hypothetical protein